MASWEIVIRDEVLGNLLRQMVNSHTPWMLDPAHEWNRGDYVVCTIADIKNVRLASPMWRQVVDSSPEWAALRLACWDYANEVGVPWEPFEVYEVSRMQQNWEIFGTTWHMVTPIASSRLRLAPVGSLSNSELDQLRTLLWDPDNYTVYVEDGCVMEPDPDMWIANHHRA